MAKEQLALAQSKGFKNHSVGRLRGKKLKIKIPQQGEQHQSPHRQVPACGTAARILVRSAPGVTTTSFTKHGEPDMAAKHSSLEHGITTVYNEKKKEQPPKEYLFSSLFSKVKEQPRGSPPSLPILSQSNLIQAIFSAVKSCLCMPQREKLHRLHRYANCPPRYGGVTQAVL